MLKSMRMGEHFIDEDSPFRGKNPEMFQEMLDGQYAGNISSGKGIGIADMLVKQLDGTRSHTSPRTNTKAPDMLTKTESQGIPLTDAAKTNTSAGEETIDNFVKSVWDKAKQAASVMGIDPKLLIAQAALETGWGKFIAKDDQGASSNNLFNIKTGNNSSFDAINIKTTEYIADTPIKVNASFRKYPSVEESFNDYVSLIKDNERYIKLH